MVPILRHAIFSSCLLGRRLLVWLSSNNWLFKYPMYCTLYNSSGHLQLLRTGIMTVEVHSVRDRQKVTKRNDQPLHSNPGTLVVNARAVKHQTLKLSWEKDSLTLSAENFLRGHTLENVVPNQNVKHLKEYRSFAIIVVTWKTSLCFDSWLHTTWQSHTRLEIQLMDVLPGYFRQTWDLLANLLERSFIKIFSEWRVRYYTDKCSHK